MANVRNIGQHGQASLIGGIRTINIGQIARQGGCAFWCAMEPFARPSGRMELRRNAGAREKALALESENAARQVLQLAMLAAINEAKQHWTQKFPLNEGFYLAATIYRTTPAEAKPDYDNYLKFIADAGTKLLWADDRFLLGLMPGSVKYQSTRQGVSVVVLPARAVHHLTGTVVYPLSIEGREMQGARI